MLSVGNNSTDMNGLLSLYNNRLAGPKRLKMELIWGTCCGDAGGARGMRIAGFSLKGLTARMMRFKQQQQPLSAGSDTLQWDIDDQQPRSPQSHRHNQQRDETAVEGAATTASTTQPEADLSWRRQYIFAAATMPSGEVGKSVGADLKRLMPEAVWLQGHALHRAQQLVHHQWLPVDEAHWAAALQVGVFLFQCKLLQFWPIQTSWPMLLMPRFTSSSMQ